jgi:ABC-type phosphate transport system auxiliary subunit
LLGLIGGPVGVAIGATVGMSGGALYDLAHLGIGWDFLSEVEKSLLPGKAAVVAEVWEEWTTPVDTRMEALGGVVFRRASVEVVDEQIERDVAALDAELAELKAERDQATGEAKAKLQAKVNAAKAQLQSAQEAIQARIEASQKETEAKIKSLQEQVAKESGKRKAKREARIAELKADQKRRSDLLKQAWELTKKALSA